MNEKDELMEFIKDNHDLEPDNDFVLSTETHLTRMARSQYTKPRYIQVPALLSVLFICTASLFLLFITDSRMIHEIISGTGQTTNSLPMLYNEPYVFIYHTHTQESFQSKFTNADGKAVDETLNITLVGKRLADSLEALQIRTIHDTTDFAELLNKKGLPSPHAFLLSREKVKQTLQENEQLLVVADIHRGSVSREASTLDKNGVTYAKIELVLSEDSSRHEENLLFAQSLHRKMETAFPGFSRGIVLKKSQSISANYNQDLFPNAVLITIGGVENTLQEEYRTVDMLAEILHEYINEEFTARLTR
ncbi:stage II sporulation protein P [Sporosarcina luteola]|nr:stage II sporulation protein P [Sporosarcina luteola]